MTTLIETGVDDWWMYPENIDMVAEWLRGQDVAVPEVIDFFQRAWEFSDWYTEAMLQRRSRELSQ